MLQNLKNSVRSLLFNLPTELIVYFYHKLHTQFVLL